MRLFITAILLGAGMLATVAESNAQSVTIGRNGVTILPSGGYYQPYQSYQSYYSTPSYQYGTPYYSQYSYPSTNYYYGNSGWNGGHSRGWHYDPPVYHRGYWHDGHYHPGHWHSGQWHRGRR